jgi:hypothetical protein
MPPESLITGPGFGWATLWDLRNNLQDPPFGGIVTNSAQGEYQTFAGLSLSQPLLKNAWYPATWQHPSGSYRSRRLPTRITGE